MLPSYQLGLKLSILCKKCSINTLHQSFTSLCRKLMTTDRQLKHPHISSLLELMLLLWGRTWKPLFIQHYNLVQECTNVLNNSTVWHNMVPISILPTHLVGWDQLLSHQWYHKIFVQLEEKKTVTDDERKHNGPCWWTALHKATSIHLTRYMHAHHVPHAEHMESCQSDEMVKNKISQRKLLRIAH